jgi:diadenosine tetraphosphatase ApaH/serine/threonine PP2A family protein phosphatase
VNVGSVGQPLDWDWRASVVIFDDSDFSIEALRVEYDRESAARKIREAHLPEYLAERFVVVA